MKRKRQLLLLAVTLFICMPAVASTRFVSWWKEKGSDKKTVAAFDLASGKVLWQKKLADSVNFVVEHPTGILAGCDDGALYLLKPEDGAQIWRTSLGKFEVNEFHAATDEGFLVSHDKRIYWLVGLDGKVKATWR